MKVGIYCRVSTLEQDATKQQAELQDFCKSKGWEVTKVYLDTISGATDSRPALNDLMIDAYNKKFEAVLIWKLDRLGRSVRHLIDVVHKFNLWNINLICKTQDIDTSTPNGKLFFYLFGAMAEFERELISERTKLGLKKAINVGKRGKDKGKRKKSGYLLRSARKLQQEDMQTKGIYNPIEYYINKG